MTDYTNNTIPEPIDGLSEITVETKCESQAVSVPGLAHIACPGLAVTMYPFGCFTVTHINSGCKISSHYERASSALLVMSQFALVAAMQKTSWSDLDETGSKRLICEAGPKDVPFDGYTSTSRNVTRKMTVREWFQAIRTPFITEFPWEDSDPYGEAIENFGKIDKGELRP